MPVYDKLLYIEMQFACKILTPRWMHKNRLQKYKLSKYVQGVFFNWPALKNDQVSDYIVNPIKKVLCV